MAKNKCVVIELNEYSSYCSDGCCCDYGLNTKVNGVEVSECSEDIGIVLERVLEHLGYEVQIVRSHNA